MDCRDLKWGRLPDAFVPAHQKEEHDLIYEWREWNSDLKIGENLVKNSKVQDSFEYGERIVIKCLLEMTKIAKRLEEVRDE